MDYDTEGQWGVGALAWAAALLGLLAVLCVRGLSPALPGVWVGTDHVITAVKLAGAVASQLYGLVGAALVVVLVVRQARDDAEPLPGGLRGFSVTVALMVLLAVTIASGALAAAARAILGWRVGVSLPTESGLLLASAAAMLAIGSAWVRGRSERLRGAALVLAGLGAAAVLRVIAVALAHRAVGHELPALHAAARWVITLGHVLELGAMLLALAWMVLPGVPSLRPRYVVIGLVLATTALLSGLALAGMAPQSAGVTLLLARAVEGLYTHPQTHLPGAVGALIEVLGCTLALVAVLLRPRGRWLSAAVALGLLSRGVVETPLGAIGLAVSGLALAAAPGDSPATALPTPS